MSKFETTVDISRKDLNAICSQNGTSIREIAKNLNCCRTTIYNYLKKGYMPKSLFDALCKEIFPKEDSPEEDLDPVFPIYTKDLLRAKFYLTRALNKMDELYLKQERTSR